MEWERRRSRWTMELSRHHVRENAAVNSFVEKYNDRITGVISCFDRMLFKGYLPIGWADAMEGLLCRQGLLIKDFGRFVEQQSERLKSHAEKLAETLGRPFEYINGKLRKDDYAKEIAKRDGITQGLICVLRILEPCQSFSVVPAEKRPKLVNATRKCLCYYFYFLDRDFGLMHVRIQSWFPLVIQICLNGHEWLARKLDKHGIEYRKQDNAFLWISDCARAQKFADRMETTNWPRVFSAIARRVNPLLKDVLAGMEYYWVMDQAEYATDVMFRDAEALKAPYEDLLKHATLCFSAEDVLTILVRSWISKPAQTSWACQHLRLLSVAPNWLGRIFLCVYKSTMCFRPGVSECCVPGRRDLFVCWDDQIARCGRDSSEMTLYHPPSILCMT